MSVVPIQIRRLDPNLPLPVYARPGDAGLDLHARSDHSIPPGGRALIGTGIAICLPEGYAGFVQPRSGLALRHGVTVLNSPGLIDSGYRDEIGVILLNTDRARPFRISRGDRVAQLVIQKVEHAVFAEVTDLPTSQRSGGFGHTGLRTA